MFVDYFDFHQQPFGVTPNPAFLYLSPAHREALADISDGIQEGRGFMALIAPPGMGKTTLLYQLMENLHGSACTAFLFQTLCEPREFFEYLLRELRIDSKGLDSVGMHAKLNEILFAEMIAGRRFVLIVDEAQNLSDEVLETVRMLSNFETSHTKLLQIVLSGQPQLAEKLAQPQLLQLRQRIAVLSEIAPFSEAETGRYIEHRVRVAAYHGEPLFTPEAVRLIARESRGIPRSINNLCYHALSTACARGKRQVTEDIAERACQKLRLNWAAETPAYTRSSSRDFPPATLSSQMRSMPLLTNPGAEPAVAISQRESAPVSTATNETELAARAVVESVHTTSNDAILAANGDSANVGIPVADGNGPGTTDASRPNSADESSSNGMGESKTENSEVALPAKTDEELIGELIAAVDRIVETNERTPETQEEAPVLMTQVEVLPALAPITYAPRKRFHLPRWDYRATIIIGVLAAGGLAFGITKFMEPSPARAAAAYKQAGPPSKAAYSADPQNIGAAQVVTVAAMPKQTLKDVATLYLGRYDEEILSEIRLLNPGISDPDHLQPGQLIRIPLPQGSFHPGASVSEQP